VVIFLRHRLCPEKVASAFCQAPAFPDVGATPTCWQLDTILPTTTRYNALLAAAAVNMLSGLTSWLAKNGKTPVVDEFGCRDRRLADVALGEAALA
jgi:hypothetical protein